MEINFVCPKCSKTRLEEILLNVTESSAITDIEDVDGEVYMDYGNVSHEGGELSHYQCLECGFVIPCAFGTSTPEALLAWLRENKMVVEDE